MSVPAQRFQFLQQETNAAVTDFTKIASSGILNKNSGSKAITEAAARTSVTMILFNNKLADLNKLNVLGNDVGLVRSFLSKPGAKTLMDLISKSPNLATKLAAVMAAHGMSGLYK